MRKIILSFFIGAFLGILIIPLLSPLTRVSLLNNSSQTAAVLKEYLSVKYIVRLYTGEDNPLKKLPKAFVIMSGSMEPAIKTGSIVFALPSSYYKQGDIITFSSGSDGKNLVTHRIEARLFSDGVDAHPVYRTSGDANQTIDADEVRHEQIVGKVSTTLPYLGYFANYAKTPAGFILLVIVPATIIIYEELKNLRRELSKSFRSLLKRNKKQPCRVTPWEAKKRVNFLRSVFGLKLAILIPVFGSFLVIVAFTGSYFSDTAVSTGNVFSAATEFPTPEPVVADHVVISEVQISGTKADEDFVELYNPTNEVVNLKGYRLVKRTGNAQSDTLIKSWTEDTYIQSHGFHLWANSSIDSYPGTISADSWTVSDITTSHSIAIRFGPNNTGAIVDAISWNEGSSFSEGTVYPINPPANKSLERKAFSSSTVESMTTGSDINKGNGFDSDNNATDFILRPLSQPQSTLSGVIESPY